MFLTQRQLYFNVYFVTTNSHHIFKQFEYHNDKGNFNSSKILEGNISSTNRPFTTPENIIDSLNTEGSANLTKYYIYTV